MHHEPVPARAKNRSANTRGIGDGLIFSLPLLYTTEVLGGFFRQNPRPGKLTGRVLGYGQP
ncbi:MAG: hypothetical protein C4334_03880 [Pyrinomonas sp.]|uniref:hypothetical protein n=1 Tax=Pyrinomonas sp. TaxID=2080306 RepID=UPI0033260F91